MSFETILFSVDNGIALLRFNRPKALNALNPTAISDLSACVDQVAADPSVKALILTGEGEKAFIAGADISGFPSLSGPEGKKFALLGQAVLAKLEALPIPVIAAVNGFALGGGLEVALACHLRVFAENAVVGLPEVTLGIIPGYGGTQRLPRVIGKGLALEMILTGKKIDAQEAYRIGLANSVVPVGKAVEEAQALAGKILRNGPVAISYALEAVNHGTEMSITDGFTLEAALFGNVCATTDKNEGAAAFLEKRRPVYKGE
jgi:enoyl-CoA hydratase